MIKLLCALTFLLAGCEALNRSQPLGTDGRPLRASEIDAVLDDWHHAASVADEERYMGHFTTQARFLGTDADERWSRVEFHGYVHSYFSQGIGWTYVAADRQVSFSPDGRVAWFDELLESEGYGELRGTGVLLRVRGQWRISQYSMAFTVPNDIAKEVTALVKSHGR